tara:strand:- start:293 stop:541 length:249 start_codon:yes stop_codon:yes gene_type:complete
MGITKELGEITKKIRTIEKEHKQYLDLLIYCRTELEKLGWCEDVDWDNKKMQKSYEIMMDALHGQEVDAEIEGSQATLEDDF